MISWRQQDTFSILPRMTFTTEIKTSKHFPIVKNERNESVTSELRVSGAEISTKGGGFGGIKVSLYFFLVPAR